MLRCISFGSGPMLSDKNLPASVAAVAGAKLVGLVAGIGIVAVLQPLGAMLAAGLVAWYVTVGAMVAVSSAYKRYPVVNLPVPWWLSGIMLGTWMNFVLTLIAGESATQLSVAVALHESALKSPMWFLVDGAVVGLIAAGVVEAIDRRR